MTESIAAILSLIVFAYDTSKSLYETVSSFKSQRKTVKDLQADLSSLVSTLDVIRGLAQGNQQLPRLEPLQQPLECCLTTCQEMREMLDVCTKHNQEERNSVRDWLSMQFHGKSLEDMKQRLASYKSTLSITLQSIQTGDQAFTQDTLEDLRNSIDGTKEDLEYQLNQLQDKMTAADGSLLEALQADQARLQSSLESLLQAQRVTDVTQASIVVRENRAGQGSRAIFGSDSSQPAFSLEVSDNEAGLGSVMSAGIHSPETLRALLAESRGPELALALQALQSQPQSIHDSGLQSVLNSLSARRSQAIANSPPEVNSESGRRITGSSDNSGNAQLPE